MTAAHEPESQGWAAAAVTGLFGVIVNVVQWLLHRRKRAGEEDEEEGGRVAALVDQSRAAEDRMENLHDEVTRLRRDFENFRSDELRWQSSIDERILRIWRRLPAGSDGD